jgi:DNA-binding NarL/FixJ family response regulator
MVWAPSTVERSMVRPLRVLLCDDSDGYRDLIRTLLGLRPFLDVVGEAADGSQAVRAAELLDPDVVILDLRMPVLDGMRTLPRLRRALPGAALLMLTSDGHDALRQDAMTLGADGYFVKGLDEAALFRRLAVLAGDVAAEEELAPGPALRFAPSVRTLRAFE